MVSDMDKPTVALDSLGCKLNQAEIQQLGRQLSTAGYKLVAPEDKADIYILNTCTVTHVADRKARHMLRLARRRNPATHIVALGCYAQRAEKELEQMGDVDLVIGNDRKWDLPRLLNGLKRSISSSHQEICTDNCRTRAFVRVQDGCRNFCAYCVVPLVRSREESVPVGQVIEQVHELESAGTKEIVLTGTEIGIYFDNGLDLKGLLERILSETSVLRLRLSSLQPPEITPELVGLWKDSRLCPHFHLSLQSGSDTILRRMKRRYTIDEYRRKVELVRNSVPDVAITTDIIVGFPGETEIAFQETCDFCRQMEFARIHVFPYSPRPGTEAASFPQRIPEKIKKERSRQMLAVADDSSRRFRQRFLGKSMATLFEQKSGIHWTGLTGSYIKLYVKSSEVLANRILPVSMMRLFKDGVRGELT